MSRFVEGYSIIRIYVQPLLVPKRNEKISRFLGRFVPYFIHAAISLLRVLTSNSKPLAEKKQEQ